jgi:hypothetical protein
VLHPTNGEEIVESLEEPISHAIFGDAVRTGIMPHRHFGHGKPMHERESREKAMHAFKHLQPCHDGLPEYFQ